MECLGLEVRVSFGLGLSGSGDGRNLGNMGVGGGWGCYSAAFCRLVIEVFITNSQAVGAGRSTSGVNQAVSWITFLGEGFARGGWRRGGRSEGATGLVHPGGESTTLCGSGGAV